MNRNKVLAHNIQTLLEKFEINQRQLSYEIDIHYMSLSKWLNGISYLSTRSLQKIADYFGVTIDSLTTERDDTDIQLESIVSTLSPTEKVKVIEIIKILKSNPPLI